MRVLVTGGTGFVGRNIVRNLIASGHDPVLLLRNKDSAEKLQPLEISPKFLCAGLQDIDVLEEGISGCEAVIHLVGIIREVGSNTFMNVHYKGTKNMVEASRRAGIKRFIHMSAEGTGPSAVSNYHKTKFMAEEYLRASGLNYTIFRPSMLFGPGDKNFNVLADFVRKAPLIPVIGNGNYRWQPVSVRNVADIFVLSLDNPRAEKKTYEVRGPDVFTFNQILEILMKILGFRKPKIHIPVGVVKPVVHLLDRILPSPPITRDQLKMLLDNYDHPVDDLLRDFNINLIPLEKELREYIKPNLANNKPNQRLSFPRKRE